MIHSISSADNASRPCLSRRPSAARKFFTIWTFFSMLIEISPFPLHQVCPLKSDVSDHLSRAKSHLGRPATRDCHVDVLTGEGVAEGLAYFSESYNCVTHRFSFGLPNPT